MLQLLREGCSNTYTPLSIARYSFIQLSELEQCRVNKLAQGFNTAAQESNPGSRNRESEALPLSHCKKQTSGSTTARLTCMTGVFATTDQYMGIGIIRGPLIEKIYWEGCHAHPGLRLSSRGSRAHRVLVMTS